MHLHMPKCMLPCIYSHAQNKYEEILRCYSAKLTDSQWCPAGAFSTVTSEMLRLHICLKM